MPISGRCCRHCKRRRPVEYLCGQNCFKSSDTCVNTSSCLCLVKCIFYHWGPDEIADDDNSCSEAPCSCAPSSHRLARWWCLIPLSLCLPCLFCYWPLRGIVAALKCCFTRYTDCNCDQGQQRQKEKNIEMMVVLAKTQQPLLV